MNLLDWKIILTPCGRHIGLPWVLEDVVFTLIEFSRTLDINQVLHLYGNIKYGVAFLQKARSLLDLLIAAKYTTVPCL